MTQSPYQHQDPRRIDLQRQLDQAQRDGDPQRLARLELQWVHRFGVDSLPQSTQIERIDAAFDQPTVSAAVPDAVLDEKPAETEALAGVEAAIFETAAAADFATADLDAGSPAEEQLVDANAETWSVLEPVPDPEPALQTDQE